MIRNDLFNEGSHGGEEDGEGGELRDVEHHHVLIRLLAGALGVRPQTRPLYHNLQTKEELWSWSFQNGI